MLSKEPYCYLRVNDMDEVLYSHNFIPKNEFEFSLIMMKSHLRWNSNKVNARRKAVEKLDVYGYIYLKINPLNSKIYIGAFRIKDVDMAGSFKDREYHRKPTARARKKVIRMHRLCHHKDPFSFARDDARKAEALALNYLSLA